MSLRVERFGEGPRAHLGLHGWGGSHRTFLPLAAHLPAGASLFAPDLPGYGGSPTPAALDLECVVRPLMAAVADLPSALTLIGNCSGAIFGLEVARRLPGRFSKLVLIDPFAWMPWYFRVFTRGSFGRMAYLSTFANPLGRRLTDRALAARRRAGTSLTESFERVDHDTTLAYLRVLAGIGPIDRWAGLSLPVTVVHGGRTFGAVKAAIPAWRRLWPQLVTHELPGVGHLPLSEAPERVAALAFEPGTGA